MMKHAFLIMAHNNWWQLKNLISLLDDETHDLYIHIDAKCNDFNLKDFEGVTQWSQISFYQKYKVYWGGSSQVQTEMFLLEKAYQVGYDYYHIISGADMPLKSNYEFHRFFEQNNGKEFIAYDDESLICNPEISRRTRLYHFLQNYRKAFKWKWLNEMFTFAERCLLALQILLRVNRVKELDWEIKYGSNWVSVTNKFVKVLLENSEKIKKIFAYTNCADELFVQTVAYNCGFKDDIYCLPGTKKTSNCRVIDWKRGKHGSPYTFHTDDYAMLISKSEYLFARKFSETVDRNIIVQLSEYIKHRNNMKNNFLEEEDE